MTKPETKAIASHSKPDSGGDLRQSLIHPEPTLKALLEAQDCAFITLDPSGSVLFVNQQAQNMLSLAPESEGCRVTDLNLPVLNELFHAALTEAQDVFVADIAIPSTKQAGELRTRAILDESGGIVGVLATIRDTRREHELDRMKADFLAAVSHELRTPLTSILGYSNLLIEAGEAIGEADRKQFLQTIETQGRVLLELINDLIEMAKLDSDSVTLRKEEVDPVQLISGIAEEFAEKAMSRELVLETKCSPTTIKVECEPVRIRQALGYLLDNAIKFTEPGGMVTLSTRETQGQLVIEVIDTGIGIAPEHLEHLFEKFFQVDAGASRKANGTGLGLAIVKRIVEMHGGQVFVESEVGNGSTFGFSLPGVVTSLEVVPGKIINAPVLVAAESGTPRASLFTGIESSRAVRPEEIVEWASYHRGGTLVLDCALADSDHRMYQAALDATLSYSLTTVMVGRRDGKWIYPFSIKFFAQDVVPDDLCSRLEYLSTGKDKSQIVLIDACGHCSQAFTRKIEMLDESLFRAHSRWAVQKKIEDSEAGLLTACYCTGSMEGVSTLKGARKAGYTGNLALFIGGRPSIPSELAGWLADWAGENVCSSDSACSIASALVSRLVTAPLKKAA